jgi:hypothetical protein
MSTTRIGTQTITAICIATAPLCLLTGWIILMLRADNGENVGWFVSHGLLMMGAVLFIPAILGARSLLTDTGWADLATGAVILGSTALVGQFAIDIAVGHLSSDQATLSALLKQISAAPGIMIPFHLAGPITFYGGILMLNALFARHLCSPRWNSVLNMVGTIAVGAQAATGYSVLALLGFAGLWIGHLPIAWRLFRRSQP